MLLHDIKCGIRVLLLIISNPNTSTSKIIDLKRPDDEWSEIAFSARQIAENEHCESLKKLVHKKYTFIIKHAYTRQ